MATLQGQIKNRRDSAADWTSSDPTLASGEIGFEEDTGKFKIGDGSTAWSSLSYFIVSTGGAAALENVVEDTTPQLGGALDVNGQEITGAIDLHSTGDVIMELGDAVGTNKVSIVDSAAAEVAAVDSDGNITTSGTVDGRDVATDGTKLDGIEALADVTDATNVDAAGATMNTDADVSGNTWVLDEDTLVSDSATKVPTQQSVKAYVDALSFVLETAVPFAYTYACSDETTAIDATGTKLTFRAPHAMTLTEVRCSVNSACTTGTLTVDINEAGTTILSTKLTIDATEETSTTAATAAVISDSAIADDAEITVDVDDVGDSTATGLKVTLIGTRDAS